MTPAHSIQISKRLELKIQDGGNFSKWRPSFLFLFCSRDRKPNLFIYNMIYHWKDNFASSPMVYQLSLCVLCVQSYRQKSDAVALAVMLKYHYVWSNRPVQRTLFSVFIPLSMVSHVFGPGEAKTHNHLLLKWQEPPAHPTSKWVGSCLTHQKFEISRPIQILLKLAPTMVIMETEKSWIFEHRNPGGFRFRALEH